MVSNRRFLQYFNLKSDNWFFLDECNTLFKKPDPLLDDDPRQCKAVCQPSTILVNHFSHLI
jgi:hypothetical protein